MLLPVTVIGPINELSVSITVVGAVGNATVQLFLNGTAVGAPVPAGGLSTQVPVAGGVLVAGQSVTAKQSRGPDTSAGSPAVTVAAAPGIGSGLPAVAFLSGLHPCIDWVLLGGLVPGATAEVFWRGNQIGSAVAEGTGVSVQVSFPQRPDPGDVLEAFQSFTAGGTTVRGPAVESLPLSAGPDEELPAPSVAVPYECDLAVLVSGLADGASLVVDHDGNELGGYPFVGNAVWASLLRPVRIPEQLSARQELRNCGVQSPSSPAVGANPAPGLPVPGIVGPICPNAPMVRLRNLRPGAEVTVTVRKASAASGSEVLIGIGRAWATDCDFPLPAGWIDHPQFAAQEGVFSLKVLQSGCEKSGGPASHPVAPLPGSVGQPRIERPVECARLIRATGLTPGAVVSVHSDQVDSQQLSGMLFVAATETVIYLYRPLRGGEKIQIHQVGCSAAASSAWTEVAQFPGIDAPVVVEPVRIPHGGVRLESLVIGARVHVFVKGVLQSSRDVTSTEMFVPVSGLTREATVHARQSLCTEISGDSNHGNAELGEMEVSVSPASITRGKPTSITVTATDRDNGQPVNGNVSIGGTVVGATGAAFGFTFGTGAAPASGVNAPDYHFAPITWQLVNPPPQPPKVLSLSIANQAPSFFTIAGVQWSIERQELNGSFTLVAAPQGEAVTVQPPTPGQYHVYAEVSVVDHVNGGTVVAEFRGNAVVHGLSTLVIVWQNQGLSPGFRLTAEPQVVFGGGTAVTIYNPVILS